jgi:c(7)-type cytochrome triheme protein
MPYVKFPHNSHTEWLACSNCHDKLFIPKAGANPITMEKIFRGEYCGTCHDRIAFITHTSCERCHSVPHGDTKAWW